LNLNTIFELLNENKKNGVRFNEILLNNDNIKLEYYSGFGVWEYFYIYNNYISYYKHSFNNSFKGCAETIILDDITHLSDKEIVLFILNFLTDNIN